MADHRTSPRVIDRLDLSDKRNVYVVGDIHGCFSILDRILRFELKFDESKDFLISVGDLVDRGPQSSHAVIWAKQPWFQHVIGNHEEFVRDTADGNSYWHETNGGEWMKKLNTDQKHEHANILMDAPYLLEVITPKKKLVGFVHADLTYLDWHENVKTPSFEVFAWSRSRIKSWMKNKSLVKPVVGVDHVFLGHTITPEPVTLGNMSWIDTGAFHTGKLTVVNVDTWIDFHG